MQIDNQNVMTEIDQVFSQNAIKSDNDFLKCDDHNWQLGQNDRDIKMLAHGSILARTLNHPPCFAQTLGFTQILAIQGHGDDGDKHHKGGDYEGDDGQTDVIVRTRPATKKPSMYKVLLLNDDYTPMQFVVTILEKFFNKSHEEATEIMLSIHWEGVGICGVFTFEIAETKVAQVVDYARKHQHPLQCTLEKE